MGNLWVKFSSQEASIWPDISNKCLGSINWNEQEPKKYSVEMFWTTP